MNSNLPISQSSNGGISTSAYTSQSSSSQGGSAVSNFLAKNLPMKSQNIESITGGGATSLMSRNLNQGGLSYGGTGGGLLAT